MAMKDSPLAVQSRTMSPGWSWRMKFALGRTQRRAGRYPRFLGVG